MQKTTLNGTDETISIIGFGAMNLSLKGRPPRQAAIDVLHRALDLGVTFFDSADSYCIDESDKHHNEELIAAAFSSYDGPTRLDEVVVATKGGLVRPEGRWVTDGDPDRLRQAIQDSWEALGGDRPIDLWQLHAPDPNHPLEASLQPAADAADEGLIRHIGVSNVSVEQLERARDVVDVVSVQNQFNPWHRKPEFDGVLDYCESEQLTFIPWSPFGGSRRAASIAAIDAVQEVARDHEASPYQTVLAWMRAKSPAVVPIPGASRVETLEDSVGAQTVSLDGSDVERLDAAFDAMS